MGSTVITASVSCSNVLKMYAEIFHSLTYPLVNSMNEEITVQLLIFTFVPTLELSAGNGGTRVKMEFAIQIKQKPF